MYRQETITSMLLLGVFLAVPMNSAFAQSSTMKKKPTSQQPASASSTLVAPVPGQGLSAQEVIQMVEAKVPENIVAAKVKKNGVAFDLSPEQLVGLKKDGASDGLIEVLMDPSKSYTPPAPAPTALAESKAAAAAPTMPEAQKPTLDIGVYLKKGADWMELRPEIVNWKTGGTIKSLASAGVVKKDLNGNIDGPSSKNSVKTPVEVLIVAPEGVAAEEYQFLRLRVNKDYREFRSVTGGILNQRSGAMRDLIPFESKKLESRHFYIVVPQTIGAGQYGFLPPGAGGSSTTNAVSSQYGKMYTFHVIE